MSNSLRDSFRPARPRPPDPFDSSLALARQRDSDPGYLGQGRWLVRLLQDEGHKSQGPIQSLGVLVLSLQDVLDLDSSSSDGGQAPAHPYETDIKRGNPEDIVVFDAHYHYILQYNAPRDDCTKHCGHSAEVQKNSR